MESIISKGISIVELKQKALAVSNAFRLGQEAQANQYCVEFIDGLSFHFPKMPEDKMTSIYQLLTVMHKAQKDRDFLFTADIVQYEILPRL